MKTQFLNSEDLILETIDDMNMSDDPANMKLFRRWAYDVGKQLITDEQLERRISIIDVTNYRAVLPDHFQIIDEVAAKTGCSKKSKLQAIASQYKADMENGCELTIDVKCPKCKKETCRCEANEYIIAVTKDIELHIPRQIGTLSRAGGTGGLFHNYDDHNPLESYDNFIYMSPSTDYKEMYKLHLPNCINLNIDSDLVYYVQNGIMETNFKDGEILLIYMGLPVSDDGDILIPDLPESIEAFQEYMVYKYFRRQYLRTSNQNDLNKYRMAETNFIDKVATSKSKLQIPAFAELAKMFRNTRLNKLNSAYGNYMKGRPATSSITKYPVHRSR